MARNTYPLVQETSTLSADGRSWLRVMVWLPDPVYSRRGVVQLVHGMAEHIERYDSFARFLAGLGYVVFGHDHIGHGKSVSSSDELGCMPLQGGKDILVADVLRAREFAHLLGERRGLDVLVGDEVIRDQRDLRGVEHLDRAHPVKLVDGHGSGDVVAQHKVKLAHEQLARAAALNAGGAREDFLCHGHAHSGKTSLKKMKKPRTPAFRRGEARMPHGTTLIRLSLKRGSPLLP